MDALNQMLRTIMFFIDNIIYGLISSAYELIAYLANVNLFSNPYIQDIVSRVYLLLGVFMLFKVSFSVIQYIIDPSSFSESGKGFGKLTTNILVALVLLISVPSLFSWAFELQNKIVTSNLIPNLIMGNSSSGVTEEDGEDNFATQARNMARDVQYIMFGAFYRINSNSSDKGGIPQCAPTSEFPSTDVFGSRDMVNNPNTSENDGEQQTCLEALDVEMAKEGPVKSRGINLGDFFKQLKSVPMEGADNVVGTVTVDGQKYSVVDNRNFSSFDSMLWWKIDGKAEYAINYTPLISTIAGGYVLLLLITFCIDIAARAIKLCFLQMIAPIAIVSYIDPKESASQGKLHNWATECLKTFFSLFLRLATIFLALKLVQIVADTIMSQGKDTSSLFEDGINPPDSLNIWIILFLILGIFTFAKQVPKMIESIFGIKMSGEMGLNPFKSLRENVGFTALSAGAVGGLANAASSFATGYRLSGGGLKGVGHGLRSGAVGAVGGSLLGGYGGFKTGGKGGYFGAGMKAAGNSAWRMEDRHGTTLASRLAADFQNLSGSPMTADIQEKNSKTYDAVNKATKGINDNADKWMAGSHRDFIKAKAAAEATQKNLVMKQRSGGTAAEINALAAQNNIAQDILDSVQKRARREYFDTRLNAEDKASLEFINRTNRENKNYDGFDGNDVTNWDELNALNKSVKTANDNLKASDTYENAHTAKEAVVRKAQYGWRKNQK